MPFLPSSYTRMASFSRVMPIPIPIPLLLVTYYLLIILWCNTVTCVPPQEPVKCSSKTSKCTVTNAYGTFPDRSICRAASAVYPTTEKELISLIATATKDNIKMKVVTRYGHSIPKLVCPNGENGLLISTMNLNKTLKVDKAAQTMTVESGVTLHQLVYDAAKADLALPYSPYWLGLTVGGMLGTGSHGSSLLGKGSAVHDHVVEIQIVSPGEPQDGYVKVRTLKEGDPDLDAAKVSLGVLGVISRVTFKLEPMFKRSITYEEKDDKDLGEKVLKFGKDHEFADMSWYPSQRKVLYRVDDRVPTTTPGNGVNRFIPFRSLPSLVLGAIRHAEEFNEAHGSAVGICLSGRITTSTLRHMGFGLQNNGGIKGGTRININATNSLLEALASGLNYTGEIEKAVGGVEGHSMSGTATTALLKAMAIGLTDNGLFPPSYPVIGYQHRLQASGGCLELSNNNNNEIISNTTNGIFSSYCPWDPRTNGEFFFENGYSIGMSQVKNFIQDIQKLVDLEPKSLCGVDMYNGFLLRYVTKSSAYLGKDEDGINFDMTYYRSKDPMTPRLFEDVLEEIEQMAVFKYGGVPHWGKNRNLAFEGAIGKFKDGHKFLDAKNKFDPSGLFSSEWSDQILGLKGKPSIAKEGCALEGLCICSEDIHCAPKKGYYCRPGRVYEKAMVCRKIKKLVTDI